jgi:hypothetical protein
VNAKGWSEIDKGINIGTWCRYHIAMCSAVAVVKICILISMIKKRFARWQDYRGDDGCRTAVQRAFNSCRGHGNKCMSEER